MRILFVDDEEMVLRMLQLAVVSMKGQWDASYAHSGPEALELLSRQSFDLVVSDMRMPEMNGSQLLNAIFKLYPGIFRVILTGFVEQERVMEVVGTAHQFLAKPFQLEALKELLQRAGALKQRLQNPATRGIIAQTGCIPSVPDVYFKILDALQEADCPIERIADITASDPGLSSKLLQLVNSAFFGFASQSSSVREAVTLLGTGTIRSLALTCRLFSAFKVEPSGKFSLEQVWAHSSRVARAAEHIARLEHSDTSIVEQAFTAGLLHDLGKLVLANALRSEYLSLIHRADGEKSRLSDLEQAALGTTHADVGASLLQLWGLPAPLIEAVLCHECPGLLRSNGFTAAIAVHVANVLDHEAHTTPGPGLVPPLDTECLERAHLVPRLTVWQEQFDS
jgi:HD-like signal output (HDOD) protein/CheY-like chemotaxis protein